MFKPAVKHSSIDTGTDTLRTAGIPADYTTFYFLHVKEQLTGVGNLAVRRFEELGLL